MSHLYLFYKENLDSKLFVKTNKGINNIGNTCFLNSVLQCLRFNKDLSQYFLSLQFKDNLLKIPNTFLTIGYYNFLKNIWLSNNKSINPIEFYKNYQKTCYKLNRHELLGFNQQDASEFLLFVLDTIDESLVDKNLDITIDGVAKDNKYDFIMNEFYKYLKSYLQSQGISIIKSLYSGFLVTQISNNFNKKSSNNFQPFTFLNLEIPINSKDIYDCFDNYCKIDNIKEYKDEKLPVNTKFFKKVNFIYLPEYFIIVLKRFYNKGNKLYKNNNLINFPFVLNMNKYTYGYIKNKNYEYNLNGVVYHQGGLNGGHYFSIVKDNDSFRLFNDSTTGKVKNLEQIVNNNAYILFYKKK